MKNNIDIVRKILNDFLKEEENSNNPELYKRKWKQFVEESILKETKDFDETQAENLLPETLKLLAANDENIGKILKKEINKEMIFTLFYSELINYLLLNEENYEELIKSEGTKINRASFCKIIRNFLKKTENETEYIIPSCFEDTTQLTNLQKEDKEKIVDFAKEIALKLSEIFEETNFNELDFLEQYLEQFSAEKVDFVEILSVFKDCNNFLEEFADYDEELILQQYIEADNIDEIKVFLSAIFSFISLRNDLKSRNEKYPFVPGEEIKKMLKK